MSVITATDLHFPVVRYFALFTTKCLLAREKVGALSSPDLAVLRRVSVETTPMGSRGIPSTVGGRGAVERAGLREQHGRFIQVRAASDA